MRAYSIELTLVAALAVAVTFFGYLGYGLLSPPSASPRFSGERAFEDVIQQVNFGSRVTGSDESREMTDWLTEELRTLGWDVAIQPFVVTNGIPARNIIAIREGTESDASGGGNVALIGARYDSRLRADKDTDAAQQSQPSPGANGGASGAAVLLELARTLDVEATGRTVCLAFFDAGSNGGLGEWEWHMGSGHFVEFVAGDVPSCTPMDFALLLGVVGDSDQQFTQENDSTPQLTAALWSVANELDYGNHFLAQSPRLMVGEHTPFAAAGIQTLYLNDTDYPHLHTMQDTADKVSPDSLERIGRAIETWLESGAPY